MVQPFPLWSLFPPVDDSLVTNSCPNSALPHSKWLFIIWEQLQFVATFPVVMGGGWTAYVRNSHWDQRCFWCACVPPVALRPPAAYHCGTGSGKRRKWGGIERGRRGRSSRGKRRGHGRNDLREKNTRAVTWRTECWDKILLNATRFDTCNAKTMLERKSTRRGKDKKKDPNKVSQTSSCLKITHNKWQGRGSEWWGWSVWATAQEFGCNVPNFPLEDETVCLATWYILQEVHFNLENLPLPGAIQQTVCRWTGTSDNCRQLQFENKLFQTLFVVCWHLDSCLLLDIKKCHFLFEEIAFLR